MQQVNQTKSLMQRLALVGLAALALTGCGKGQALTAAAPLRATAANVVMANGHAHKLGFDATRYQQEQAPAARPHHLTRQGLTPPSVDLRADMSPVADQGDLSSCTAFAVAKGLREGLQVNHHEARTALSPLFLYFETRKLRGPKAVQNDTGATLTDAMKALAGSGVATEAAWPYDMAKFTVTPPAAAYKTAPATKLQGVQLAGLDDIKTALANHQPVVFGMKLYNTFQNVGADGNLPLPITGDVFVGGHAVTAVGYDDRRQVLILKNSFGESWGDHGYFYMPYGYMANGNVMDIWTAQ